MRPLATRKLAHPRQASYPSAPPAARRPRGGHPPPGPPARGSASRCGTPAAAAGASSPASASPDAHAPAHHASNPSHRGQGIAIAGGPQRLGLMPSLRLAAGRQVRRRPWPWAHTSASGVGIDPKNPGQPTRPQANYRNSTITIQLLQSSYYNPAITIQLLQSSYYNPAITA